MLAEVATNSLTQQVATLQKDKPDSDLTTRTFEMIASRNSTLVDLKDFTDQLNMIKTPFE